MSINDVLITRVEDVLGTRVTELVKSGNESKLCSVFGSTPESWRLPL